MQYSIKTKLCLDFTLDSSEAVMFSKGGKQTVLLRTVDFDDDCDEKEIPDLRDFDDIEVTFQIEKSQFGRFDFVNEEAKKHRQMWDKINGNENKSS